MLERSRSVSKRLTQMEQIHCAITIQYITVNPKTETRLCHYLTPDRGWLVSLIVASCPVYHTRRVTGWMVSRLTVSTDFV